MTACDKHPEREAVSVILPAALHGVPVRYLCIECRDAERITTPYQGKREAWDHASYDYARIGHDLYTRTSAGWRCEEPSTNDRRWK